MDISKLFSLEGRVAVVTGGSRNLGRQMVEGYLAAGCSRVYITARKAAQVEQTVTELGERVIGIPGDLSTMEGVETFAADFASREDKLDILVNNAGAAWGADLPDFPEAGWDKVMDVNLKAPFFLTQKLLPQLQAAASKERPAKVIMIASIDWMRLNPWETYSYQASKAGLVHLTGRMAARLIRENIVVSGIGPGAFASDMNKAARDNPDMLAKGIPSGRIGEAEDIAGLSIYLASRAGDYVVGTTIPVDGGMVNANIGGGFGADPSGR